MSTSSLVPFPPISDAEPDESSLSPGVQTSPANPETQEPDDAIRDLGISDADKDHFVRIITSYRTGWAADRLLRLAGWMKNQLFFRGRQIVEWDREGKIWQDALALYRQSGESVEGDDTYLEKWVCNITLMLGEAFISTLSRAAAASVVEPENAEVLADVTTAKAAQEAISIIERMNDIRSLGRREDTMLYLYGTYFKRTSVAIDGDWAGWDEQPEVDSVEVGIKDHYHCQQCGTDTDAEAQPLRQCPDCGQAIGAADFYPGGQTEARETSAGVKKVPRAMIKWTLHSPLEIDYDPEAARIEDTPILACDREVDVGWLRSAFLGIKDQIQEGAPIETTPNASYERLRRSEIYSEGFAYTADTFQQKPTYSEVWIQPFAYERLNDGPVGEDGRSFGERMRQVASQGVMLGMIGNKVVTVKPAVLRKEWSRCLLHEECSGYSPSIADNVVPFNERFNSVMGNIDEFFEYAANGVTIYDTSVIDKREIDGKTMAAGVMTGVRRKAGQERPLSDAIWQFAPTISSFIFQWPGMLLNFAELISGVVPQTFGGGTQENVATLGGQRQQLNQAQERLNIFFKNKKAEHAAAAQNAIEMLQQAWADGLIKQLWSVIKTNGSEFRSQYVNLDKINGRIRVYPDTDQELPQSPEQLRQIYEMVFEEAGKGNPAAVEFLDVVPNQEVVCASLFGPDLVLPRAAQRARTEQHINLLMETPWRMAIDPQSGVPTRELPVKPAIGIDDWKTLKDTIKRFRQENFDQEPQNPDGWARLEGYYQLALNLEMQEAIEDAARKQKVVGASQPAPDPTIQQEKQELLQHAAAAVERNAVIGQENPNVLAAGGKQLSAIVAANKGIVDAALKVAK